MSDLQKLQELAGKLPKEAQKHAAALVEKMGQVIEGIGDNPISWRPENLRIVQPSSDRTKLPKGVQIGGLLLGEHVVQQPLKTIPLRMWDSRQMWSPDKDEARLLCSSPDGVLGYIGKYCKECEFSKFDTENNRSACNKAKTVMSISADLGTVFVVNFTKTNYANGRDWATLMRKAGVAPFKKVYDLKTETNKKFKNVESLVVSTENESTPEAYIPFLEELFTRVGSDREEHKKKFYEIVMAKKESQALLESNAGPAEENTGTLLPAEAASANEAQSSMAKKYTI